MSKPWTMLYCVAWRMPNGWILYDYGPERGAAYEPPKPTAEEIAAKYCRTPAAPVGRSWEEARAEWRSPSGLTMDEFNAAYGLTPAAPEGER